MSKLEQVFIMYDKEENTLFPLREYRFCPKCGYSIGHSDFSLTTLQCSNCKYVIYTNPFPTVVVLIEHEGKILLGKRKGRLGKGKWCIPGGYIEYNEDFISAGYREIKEETGLDNHNIAIVSIINVVSNFVSPARHVLSVVLLGKFISGNPSPADDLDELHWYSLKEPLPEMFLPAEKNLIENYATAKLNEIAISKSI